MSEVGLLFQQLKTHIDDDNLHDAAGVCESILKAAPGDADASKTLLALSLQNNDFKRALSLLKSFPDMLFEKAYALYRTYEEKSALEILSSIPADKHTDGTYHLLAQIYYRLGQFDKCVETYEQNFDLDELDDDMKANLLAAYANSSPVKALKFIKKLGEEDLTHELAYNSACALVDANELQQAYAKLEQAKQLCRETLEADDADQNEIKDELAVLTVQQAYVLQCQNKPTQALQLYLQVLEDKPSDEAVVATASNNIITLRKKDEKIFDSLKRSNRACAIKAGKLSLRQQRAIQSNKCLLLLLGKKGDKSREVVEKLQQEFSGSEVPVLVLASMYYREKNTDKCDAILDNFIGKHPTDCLQAKLTKAHLLLLQGKFTQTIQALKDLGAPLCYRPAVIATVVSLCERNNEIKVAVQALDEAVTYWKSKKEDEQTSSANIKKIYHLLLQQSAQFRSRHSMEAEATELFSTLVQLATTVEDRQFYLSKLVVAYAQSNDEASAQKFAQNLPPLELSNINVDKLESSDFTSKRKIKDTKREGDKDKEDKKKEEEEMLEKKRARRKKKRKIRYPKGFDPENPGPMPDPERWLPKYERSTYKKGKRRRNNNQGIARGPQGTSYSDKTNEPQVFEGISAAEKAANEQKKVKIGSTANQRRQQRKKGRR